MVFYELCQLQTWTKTLKQKSTTEYIELTESLNS